MAAVVAAGGREGRGSVRLTGGRGRKPDRAEPSRADPVRAPAVIGSARIERSGPRPPGRPGDSSDQPAIDVGTIRGVVDAQPDWYGQNLDVAHLLPTLSTWTWSPSSWLLDFAVIYDGAVVGVQTLEADRFPTLRTVDSGSWLVMSVRGRGVGVAMRMAVRPGLRPPRRGRRGEFGPLRQPALTWRLPADWLRGQRSQPHRHPDRRGRTGPPPTHRRRPADRWPRS